MLSLKMWTLFILDVIVAFCVLAEDEALNVTSESEIKFVNITKLEEELIPYLDEEFERKFLARENNETSVLMDQDQTDNDEQDYDYDLLTSYSLEDVTEGNATHYDYDTDDRARWSFAPKYFIEKCSKSCKEEEKPFGRLLGARCQCICPLLHADDLDLCSGTGKCDRFCSSQGYYRGGDCIYNDICFCYCKHDDAFDIDRIYTKSKQNSGTFFTVNKPK